MTSAADTAVAQPHAVTRTATGWLLLAIMDAYAAVIYYGFGVPAGEVATRWWHPTTFLTMNYGAIGQWEEQPAVGVALFTIPAILLAIGVFWGTRSALARALACTTVLTIAIFVFAGYVAYGAWLLFHWRASVVMILTGLAVGCTLTAPLLGASWLRQKLWVKLVLYLPLLFVIVAVVRGTTGTDERLLLNFAPWPIVTIFGLEMGAYTVVGFLYGLALGVLAFSLRRERPLLATIGIALALALPVAWFVARFSSTKVPALVGVALIAAIGLALAVIVRGGDRQLKLQRRALHLALGATLAAVPLLTGRALADGDYTVNKHVRAREIIDALALHYENDDGYPDKLQALIDKGYLDEIPRPRVGFQVLYAMGLLDPLEFSYRSLGSSYVLEFTSTEWVQCAYNPPWEDADEYEDEEGYEEYEAVEAWSCPETRPELW